MAEFVEDGAVMDEVVAVARWLEQAGVTLINTGIGWHEARVPTIVTSVPRASFVRFTKTIKDAVNIPVIAANRINIPETAEEILVTGQADMVQMARPFLADSDWVEKAKQGKAHLINTCIGCNQACLDHTFENKRASCLVNPLACHETEYDIKPAKTQACRGHRWWGGRHDRSAYGSTSWASCRAVRGKGSAGRSV